MVKIAFYIFLASLIVGTLSKSAGHPSFDLSFETVFVEEGNVSEINCTAEGDRPMYYTWYNSAGEEILSVGDIFSNATETGNNLVLNVTEKKHAGIYSCKASNVHGSDTKLYAIIVNETLDENVGNDTTVFKKISIFEVTESSVEFRVETLGNATGLVIKVQYREQLNASYLSKSFSGGEKIIIDSLIPSGNYAFEFSIESSEIKVQRSLNVILLPKIPDGIIRDLRPEILGIGWFRTWDDYRRGTIDEHLLSYKPIRQQGANDWDLSGCSTEIRITSCGNTRHAIAGLSRGTYYEIRLTAHTASGYGKPYINKVFVPQQ